MVQKNKKQKSTKAKCRVEKRKQRNKKMLNTEPNRNREFIVNERGKALVVSAKDANGELRAAQ